MARAGDVENQSPNVEFSLLQSSQNIFGALRGTTDSKHQESFMVTEQASLGKSEISPIRDRKHMIYAGSPRSQSPNHETNATCPSNLTALQMI